MKPLKNTRTILVLLAAAIAGCSDSPNEPDTVGVSGTLTFSYTGAGASSSTVYTATGAIPSNVAVNNGTQPWAAGGVDASNNQTVVWGVIPKSGTTWDMSFITINRTTVGSSTIDPACTANNCTSVGVWFGANNNETNWTYLCELTSGTVTISAISSTNVTGTFSGTGTCITSSGVESAFTMSNGSFNVGVTALLQ